MAKTSKPIKKRGKKAQPTVHETIESDLVQVDAFMIPAPFAAMYRVLREAVAEDIEQLLQAHYPEVKRVADNPEEGEAVVAYDATGIEQVRIYLNPTTVSQAQKSRDKQQMDKFVEQFLPGNK